MTHGSTLDASTKGVTSQMVAALLKRGLTSVLNILLLQYVSADEVGFAAVDMEVLLATVIFLSTESSRLVARRAPVDILTRKGVVKTQFLNLSYLPILLSLLFIPLFAFVKYFYLKNDGDNTNASESFSFMLYFISAIIECFCAPLIIILEALLLHSSRASAEVIASTVKCVVTFVLAAKFSYGVKAYAFGQLAYAIAFFFSLYHGLHNNGGFSWKELLPRWISTGKGKRSLRSIAEIQFGKENVGLWMGMLGQSLIKHFLTQGDNMLLMFISTRHVRGVYSVVANYGSLVARILFQPIEYSTGAFISKLPWSTTNRALTASEQQVFRPSLSIFQQMFKLVMLVSLLIACFGSALSPVAEVLLLRSRASLFPQFANSLSAYTVYIVCMGLNGITEAVSTASSDRERIVRANWSMLLAFLLYAFSALLLVPPFGTPALVLCNCVNMLVRSASSIAHVNALLRARGLSDMSISIRSVSPSSVGVLAVSSVLLWALRLLLRVDLRAPRGMVVGCAAAVLLLLICLVVIWKHDGRNILQTYRRLRAPEGAITGPAEPKKHVRHRASSLKLDPATLNSPNSKRTTTSSRRPSSASRRPSSTIPAPDLAKSVSKRSVTPRSIKTKVN